MMAEDDYWIVFGMSVMFIATMLFIIEINSNQDIEGCDDLSRNYNISYATCEQYVENDPKISMKKIISHHEGDDEPKEQKPVMKDYKSGVGKRSAQYVGLVCNDLYEQNREISTKLCRHYLYENPDATLNDIITYQAECKETALNTPMQTGNFNCGTREIKSDRQMEYFIERSCKKLSHEYREVKQHSCIKYTNSNPDNTILDMIKWHNECKILAFDAPILEKYECEILNYKSNTPRFK